MDSKQIRNTVINNIIIRVALFGALQRNHVYKKKTTSSQRRAFRNFISGELSKCLKDILNQEDYTDKKHRRMIVKFSKECSSHKQFSKYLIRNRLRLGTAQKLVNLYWKTAWVLKPAIRRPIHCPFDAVIIKALGNEVKHIKWTKSDSITDYDLLVTVVKKKIKRGQCIAAWELESYGIAMNYQ